MHTGNKLGSQTLSADEVLTARCLVHKIIVCSQTPFVLSPLPWGVTQWHGGIVPDSCGPMHACRLGNCRPRLSAPRMLAPSMA